MSTSTQYPQATERDHSSGADQQSASNQGQHKRVYQACIPCRRRKVKCDLGSVDNPGDPPCVRCRRESKECYFSATRRKRKLNDGEEGSADGYDFDDDYIVRNGRKRLNSNGGVEPPRSIRQLSVGLAPSIARYVEDLPQAPLTPGGHIGRTQPLRRPQQSPDPRDERNDSDANVRFENPEAQDVMRQQVYGPHDALDLLYKAATDSPGHKRARSSSNVLQSPVTGNGSPSVLQRSQPRSNTSFSRQPQHMGPPAVQRDTKIDPALTSEASQKADRTQDPGYKDALRAWSRFRFVRAGWFTPAEAIEYLEYYYEYLSPLTPISPPTFRNPGTHSTLLTEEPILTVTLLTIASRYRQIPGAGGHCRSHAIHEQLWTYLRGMVERCLWGQEAFGGGFCGSGAIDEEQSSSTAPWRGLRKGSLRTLGTVESLMILTEWHPRALHFPPQDATDELMLPSYDGLDNFSTDEEGNHKPGGVGGKRIESWLEPAWRSDRMCWMLLSNAMGLSYELGVFDNIEELLAAGGDITRPEYEDEAYRLRAARIKKLLLIYVTQLAGRLGWTNMVPEHLRSTTDKMESRKRRASDSNTPGTSTSISNAFQYIPDLELDDQIIHCWSGITTAMRIGNERIFKSRSYTTEIIQSGKYIALLKDFQPMLKNWRQTFEGFRLPPYIRHILTIEFEYVRIYINSLSLQAVVERSTGPSAGTLGPLSPETQNYYGKLPLAHLGGFGPADQEYVREVVDGSRNLLRTVVDGLLPGGFLKHAPVRTYFRIISGAMFLLKTFALGASKNDVEVSIGLMDRAVDALRTCVVDDVHLGIRFADLLETLTSRLRNRFMHAPAAAQGGDGGERASPRLGQGIDQRLDAGAEKQGWSSGTPRYQEPHILVDHNAGISSTEFDLGTGAFYPNPLNHGPSTVPTNNNVNNNDPSHVYDMQSNNASSGFGGGPDWISSDDLWYLPAGAAFFQNQDQAVTQTAEGINVGGMDLLDYMTLDQNFGLDGVGF